MDDLDAFKLAAFLSARIGEEDQAAYTLSGTEWTVNHLGDLDYEIWVIPDPLLLGTAPTSGIADVQRADVAHWIAAHSPRRAQLDMQPDHQLIAEYATARNNMVPGQYKGGYIDALEWMIKTRAARYSSHPDYDQAWKP